MSKIVTVFDCTCQLGSAVVQGLSSDFNVRAATPDPTDPNLDNLRALGPNVNVVTADADNASSLDDALDGANGCFIITKTDFEGGVDGYKKEVRQGEAIADACARAGIEHVLYSTQLSVVQTIGVTARHHDAKYVVDSHMKNLGLPLTSVIIPCLYESFLETPLRPKMRERDRFELDIPMGSTSLCMMSLDDIGVVVSELFKQRNPYLHKTISVCGDKLTTREIAATLTKYLHPKVFTDKQMTVEEYGNQPFPGARDLAHMYEFYRRVDQKHSIDLTKQLNPNTRRFDQWIQNNLEWVTRQMDCPVRARPDPWGSV